MHASGEAQSASEGFESGGPFPRAMHSDRSNLPSNGARWWIYTTGNVIDTRSRIRLQNNRKVEPSNGMGRNGEGERQGKSKKERIERKKYVQPERGMWKGIEKS
jgi:hypothetical protein